MVNLIVKKKKINFDEFALERLFLQVEKIGRKEVIRKNKLLFCKGDDYKMCCLRRDRERQCLKKNRWFKNN